ncbi:DODA-type extradiol aromatic ring-opening family dioxygenase [Pseudoduganella namucuonensis]|uniref:Aromatic ring-opening dioxygenase, catalytic subunit, LigB family n=1 Tax=Pseudoduganella namucuonensis TaxID=1035707 RepID=A0A1I7I3D3_9BURK|nr:class III extradiol ring-cleavage dioxygenase [Pseudoduganella namucuonensis]SFU67473.1 Aromatic ring-opening dioxygenase, catalytic subunit, LigB family [Pseudoduganella namucuonensis]
MSEHQLPTYFVSHGGGPWPWMLELHGTRYDALKAALEDMPRQLGATPKAVLVVTAHWEASPPRISSGAAPGMIYDYGGFPDYTYRIQYPAPGSPGVAARVQALLAGAGIAAELDAGRGYDHGTFSAMKPIYPEADVPIVQLSLKRGLDAAEHLAMGRALAPLRREGVLIVGSGLSYHNLRQFGAAGAAASHRFDAWLREAMALPPAERTARLLDWERAPAARLAHPREEHLLPLMVALGAAEGDAAANVYHEDDFMGGLAVSSFRFG